MPPLESAETPWIILTASHDVEAWIDNYNFSLQQAGKSENSGPEKMGFEKSLGGNSGIGICFRLEHGGEIFVGTTGSGEVLLDVTPEAAWVAPLITAATGAEVPDGKIFHLPGDKLTQLVLGLSSLIAATRPISGHNFKIKN